MKKLLLGLFLALGLVGLSGCGGTYIGGSGYHSHTVVHHYHTPVIVHHTTTHVVHHTVVHHSTSTVRRSTPTSRPTVSLRKR